MRQGLRMIWYALTQRCNPDDNYSLGWFHRKWVTFKIIIAIILSREYKYNNKYYQKLENKGHWYADYPDAYVVAVFGFRKGSGMEYEYAEWTELRLLDEKGLRLVYDIMEDGYP